MKEYKIKFQLYLYDELQNHLFKKAPSENGCFLIGEAGEGVINITEVIYPDDEDDLFGCEEYCSPNSRYILKASRRADEQKCSLFFVHSHPKPNHPATFSELDLQSNERLFENISSLVSSPIGSLVFSQRGIYGTMYYKGDYHSIKDYTVIGKGIKVIPNYSEFPEGFLDDNNVYDRQRLMMSGDTFEQLQSLKILIVGCGGLGMPTAISLAKQGVRDITICDYDKIEDTNLPRLECANSSDIGRYKVDVAKEFIEKMTEAIVTDFKFKLQEAEIDLSHFDVIFGCLDNHTARGYINNVAIQFAIPLIDMACAIPLNKNGNVEQAVGSVTVSMPKRSCLICTGAISSQRILEEAMSTDELKNLQDEGYAQSVEKAPSVRSLTATIANLGVSRLFNLLGVYSLNFPVRVVYNIADDVVIKIQEPKESDCICKSNSVW